jgi:hypothetical protein
LFSLFSLRSKPSILTAEDEEKVILDSVDSPDFFFSCSHNRKLGVTEVHFFSRLSWRNFIFAYLIYFSSIPAFTCRDDHGNVLKIYYGCCGTSKNYVYKNLKTKKKNNKGKRNKKKIKKKRIMTTQETGAMDGITPG